MGVKVEPSVLILIVSSVCWFFSVIVLDNHWTCQFAIHVVVPFLENEIIAIFYSCPLIESGSVRLTISSRVGRTWRLFDVTRSNCTFVRDVTCWHTLAQVCFLGTYCGLLHWGGDEAMESMRSFILLLLAHFRSFPMSVVVLFYFVGLFNKSPRDMLFHLRNYQHCMQLLNGSQVTFNPHVATPFLEFCKLCCFSLRCNDDLPVICSDTFLSQSTECGLLAPHS